MDEFIGYVLGLPVVQVTMYKVQGTFLHRWDQQPLQPAEFPDCFQTMTSSSAGAASFRPVGWVLDPAEAEHDRQQTYVLWRTDDIVAVSAEEEEEAAAPPRHRPGGRRSKVLQRPPRRPGPKARRDAKSLGSGGEEEPTAEDFVEHEACSALARALQEVALCKPYSPSLRGARDHPGSGPVAGRGSLGPVSRVLAWMLDAETSQH